MARSAIHIVQHRRRREQRTDYGLRLSLLRSGKPRLVVRKSNAYVYGQIVSYDPSGDKTLVQSSSSELREMGWKHNCGNVTAAYLAGILLGTRAKKAGVKEAILDIGLNRSTKGNVLYGYLKGVVDAGISVPHSADALPQDERLTGKHIKAETEFEAVKKKIAG